MIAENVSAPKKNKRSKPILVVGAGFAGAVHARVLAEQGFQIRVIDKRPHIAGNAYDEVNSSGVRVHHYGPHLFHTNNERVVEWLQRFGAFVPYQHKVQAELEGGGLVPMPINRQTINTIFDTQLADEAVVREFLAGQAVACEEPANAAEYLNAHIGVLLTDLFFRRYTKKMWAHDLEEMSATVVQRIPLRYDDEDRYFPADRFQMMPRDGYTQIFAAIFDHPNITVELSTAFDKAMLDGYDHCFNSMPIDEFFDESYGKLPYRSIRFHHIEVPVGQQKGYATTINYTDEGPMTRQTDWSLIPRHHERVTATKTITIEEPCDYADNNFERYYPVKTSDGFYDSIYRQYKALADSNPRMSFIGRCGTYQYLDMHQVINQSLEHAEAWIGARPTSGG